MLLERHPLDAASAIERLGGMQAQYSPSPYIGLWSRLLDFRREELEAAVRADRVFKATLLRGTLHLVAARDFDRYRLVSRGQRHVYTQMLDQLRERGVDVEAARAALLGALRERPLKKLEAQAFVRPLLPGDVPDWAGWSIVALEGELVTLPDDALFGAFGGGRYRPAPPLSGDLERARIDVAAAYFAAFGPASRADLAAWSGQTVGSFSGALEALDLVPLRTDDGRTLYDLREADRPAVDRPVPVRFLPKWDNLLLAYERRERVLPEPYRKTVIRKNGDVLPTFLVDGFVAGAWEAPLRGRAFVELTPLRAIDPRERAEVEVEAERLLAWLRPDVSNGDVRWSA